MEMKNQQTKSPWTSAKLGDEIVGDHHHARSGRNGVLNGGCFPQWGMLWLSMDLIKETI